MNKQEQADDYTIDKIQIAVDDIIADENKKCNSDINIIRGYGWTVIVIVVVYIIFIANMRWTQALPLYAGLVSIHQIVLSLAAIQARQSRKLASMVAIMAVFASTYQDMTVDSIRKFFESIEEKAVK